MLQNNPLLAQLKQQMRQETAQVQGIIRGHSKGFGFIEVEGDKSYFIPPPSMKKLWHGDRITARLRSKSGQTIVEPERLIEAALTQFVGRLDKVSGRLAIIPDVPGIHRAISCQLDPKIATKVAPGDWVTATLKQHPLQKGGKLFHAEVSDWITRGDDNFAPWWVSLARYQLPRQAPDISDVPSDLIDNTPRIDLTQIPFVTLDGQSTQDMDDALAVRKGTDNQLILMIAIADPTAYVAYNSEIDRCAQQRGFTHYLPSMDIPMLPRQLADNLCSLRTGEQRPAIVCQMAIGADGSLASSAEFLIAWIRSQAKLDYQQVSDWLEGTGDWAPPTAAVAEQIQLLWEVAKVRTAWRQQHTSVFKDRSEYRLVVDDQGNVVDVAIEERRIAHRMVEEAMIVANLCAARLLRDHLGYGMFTVHNGLEKSQIDQVISLLQANQAPFSAEQLLTPEGFCELRRYLDAQPTAYLTGCLRRYQGNSSLSWQPAAHYGMGCDVYATWTSPIRKYGDLINQRLLKAVIAQRTPEQFPGATLATYLNERRRKQRLTERQINDWLYARFLQQRLKPGEQQLAEIIDVTRGGLRGRLLENGAVIFLPSSSLHPIREELICCQESGYVLIKGKPSYRLGDNLSVVLRENLLENRHVLASPAA